MSRRIGTEAAITIPSATEATGRLKMTMRSDGVARQRRAPTIEPRSQARLPARLAVRRARRRVRGTRLNARSSAPEIANVKALRSSTSCVDVSPTSGPPRAAPTTFVSVCALRMAPLAASRFWSSTSIGTTTVETILKIPVVTPQIKASATIVPARPVVTISAQAAAASSSQAARPARGGTRSSRCPSTVPRITAGRNSATTMADT